MVTTAQRYRVLMADDHNLVIEGIKKLLEPHFDLVGAVTDGRALLDAAEELRPDLILVDISMPLLNGLDATRQLVKRRPGSKVVVLSMHADPAYVSEAFAAGACGYLLKSSVASELVFAMQEVLKGRYYLTPSVTKDLVGSLVGLQGETLAERPEAFGQLTPRQREVLQLVAEGKTNKEVARILGISLKTVWFLKAGSMREIGVRTTAGLTRYAVAHGIVSL